MTLSRELATISKGFITINEDELDIFKYFDYDKNFPNWVPSIDLPPFDESTKIYLDIETYSNAEPCTPDDKPALDPDRARIVLIGLMNESGKSHIIDCEAKGEAQGILEFFHILKNKNPQFLVHFNGFSFDLPFIIRRCKHLNLTHPFYVAERETVFRTAQRFSEPAIYKSIWLNRGQTAVIDLYHQSLAWDFVNRKLTSYSLKQIPLQMGLRDEARLTLSWEDMKICVESGDLTRLKEYLVYDLEDSKILGDLLLPDIYYQKLILPDWNYHSLSTAGNGTKWNDILTKQYKAFDESFELPKPDTVLKFKGGLTGGRAGLYRNVAKIDVESLYPNTMDIYGICSYKDTLMLTLAILKYLKTERVRLKKLAKSKKGTVEGRLAKQRQGALKVLINSAYGFLGTGGIGFNDYVAAAFVTAYGRAILKKMIEVCVTCSGRTVSWDTDGLYYATDDDTFEFNRQIHQAIQSAMPKGIKLDYEDDIEARAFYVPPANDSDDPDLGLKKNYIIVTRDGSVQCKGKFVKRDKCVLEKEFIPSLVKAYAENGVNEAKKVYQQTVIKLVTRTYPVENLCVTRKIKANEKRLVELGLGQAGEVITMYKAPDKPIIGKRGFLLKEVEVMWTLKVQEIDWKYYIDMVNEMWKEFSNVPKY